jgi:hypothetical protein
MARRDGGLANVKTGGQRAERIAREEWQDGIIGKPATGSSLFSVE